LTTLEAQMIFANDNGNPADAVMNVWHFKTDDVGTPAEEGTDVEARIFTFYQYIDDYLSSFLSGAYTIKVFDLADPEPRVAVWEHVSSITPGTGNGIPDEVCVALSYQAERVSGEPQARRRGRLYIGPLNGGTTVLSADTSAGDCIVHATFRADLATAAAATAGVFTGASSGSAIAWCTYSPTDRAGGKTLAQSSHNVTDGWIDFAVDIQRRRGHAPSARTLWTV